jgi:hypothetical protein
MFKFALIAGICVEWLHGPAADSAAELALAGQRALLLTLAAWMGLELLRVLWRAILTLDHYG